MASQDSEREQNFWGWGYADRIPSEEELEEYASFLEEELNFPERPIREPPSLTEVELPDSGVTVPDELSSFCTKEKSVRANHTYGSSRMDYYRRVAGDFSGAPDIVSRPKTETQVQELLTWASENNIAVIPYGGGTGVVGGTEAPRDREFDGVISISLDRMNQVLEVDQTSRRALIQAGTLTPEINDQLADHELHLRHYPQSYEFASLGGMIATRSGGHYATQYTHIDDFVESLRMITPAGAFETLQVPASGAGPDPNRMVMGSEGSLGIITRAWMRVEPRPEYRSDISVHFQELEDAVRAMRRIVQAGLTPANCRLHDRNEVQLYGLSDVDAHLVVLGFESTDHSTESDAERSIEICESEGGAVAEGPHHYGPGFGTKKPESEKQEFGQAFQEGPYTSNYNTLLSVVGGTIETSVTWDRFHSFYDDLIDTLETKVEDVCGTGIITTRFTHIYPDGPAPYVRFFAPGEQGNEIAQQSEIKEAGLEVVQDHGLTTTHHHAIGRDHKPWYKRESPENFEESLLAVKSILDPAGIMNPGVLVD